MPPHATVLVKLNEVHVEEPDTEAASHSWLQNDFSFFQYQTVFNSVMYAGFLKKRVAAQLKNAQEDKTQRPALLPLLQEAASSVEMAAELKIVATLDDSTVKLKQKVDLLRMHRRSSRSGRA